MPRRPRTPFVTGSDAGLVRGARGRVPGVRLLLLVREPLLDLEQRRRRHEDGGVGTEQIPTIRISAKSRMITPPNRYSESSVTSVVPDVRTVRGSVSLMERFSTA
jgi:hypothetical protein